MRAFTSPQSPPESPAIRGLGWDIHSPFSGNRGDLFPVGSYGHTGFTGTSIWIDPFTDSYVILLANAVHPHHKGAITGLRSRVATIAAAGLGVDVRQSMLPASYAVRRRRSLPPRQPVRNLRTMTGLDVLGCDGFPSLKGRRVGLITNHTGMSREGKPKHRPDARRGRRSAGRLFARARHRRQARTRSRSATRRIEPRGLPVYSLYAGDNRRPTAEMLRGIDTLVFDIQDIGVRFYTYACTMAIRDGRGRAARVAFRGSRPAQPDHRRTRRRPGARQRCEVLCRMPRGPGQPRDDGRRVRPAAQRRDQSESRTAGDRHAQLGAGRLVG